MTDDLEVLDVEIGGETPADFTAMGILRARVAANLASMNITAPNALQVSLEAKPDPDPHPHPDPHPYPHPHPHPHPRIHPHPHRSPLTAHHSPFTLIERVLRVARRRARRHHPGAHGLGQDDR